MFLPWYSPAGLYGTIRQEYKLLKSSVLWVVTVRKLSFLPAYAAFLLGGDMFS